MSKRLKIAKLAQALGLIRVLESASRFRNGPGILIIDHHRIGDGASSIYDRGVFGATAEKFDQQLRILKSRYNFIGLPECQHYVENPSELKHFLLMLTFDDGFRDNFDIALPILKSHGVSATFFLVTSLIGSSVVPWWDRIAYMVRNAPARAVQLHYPTSATIPLVGDREISIRNVLRHFKCSSSVSTDKYLAQIEEVTGVTSPVATERRFIDWSEARRMLSEGMSIGSHTRSHTILSQLSYDDQILELRHSKQELESQLRTKIDAIAYPVGSRTAFTSNTQRAVAETGYRTAFSKYGGVNAVGSLQPYDLRRIDSPEDLTQLRFSTAFLAMSIR